MTLFWGYACTSARVVIAEPLRDVAAGVRIPCAPPPDCAPRDGGLAASDLVTRRMLSLRRLSVLLALGLASPLLVARAQTTPPTPAKLAAPDVERLAGVHVALLKLQDSLNAEMAQPRNKTAEGQQRLQEQLRLHVTGLFTAAGMTDNEFQRRRFAVSTDSSARRLFDDEIVRLTGVPARTVAATPAAAAPVTRSTGAAAATALPAGAVGAHIGHVLTSFSDTPDKAGLLPTARAEAGIAAQHAAFAARTPSNLDAMKLHTGHVLHAIDPALVTSGPGKGYGLKKAATGVATHIQMAAAAESATAGVRTHAEHVATASRSVVVRADQIIALAQRIRDASDAETAAALVGQLLSLCEQLVSGADLDADGRVSWGGGEGGLQQAEAHMQLLLNSATPGA